MIKSKTRLYLASALAAVSISLLSSVATAQAVSADRQIAYAIPAQSLAGALRQFAETSGLQLVYDAKITEGKTSPGVSGTMDARGALAQLLAGSGIASQVSSDGAVMLSAAGGQGVRALGVINVEGTGGFTAFADKASPVNGVNGSRDVQATEGTGSYTSNALAVGTKSPQSIKDTPLAVSVVTQQRIQDQNITTLRDALNQMPGVSLVQDVGGQSTLAGTTNQQIQFYSRGFLLSSFQIDGGAPLGASNASISSTYNPVIDLAEYDSIQVIRGAAGVFNGFGDPGGVVSLQRKKPLDHDQLLIEAQLGSWNNYRAVADVTGPMGFGGKLRGRLVGVFQDNDFYYRVAHSRKELVYGILEFDATPTTLLRAGASYTNQDDVIASNGLPRYNDGGSLGLPVSTCLCFPWNRGRLKTTEIFGEVDQKIGAAWSLVVKATYNRQVSAGKYGYVDAGRYAPGNTTPGIRRLTGTTQDDVTLEYIQYATKPRQLALDGTLSGHFRLFGQDQELQVGGNYSNNNSGNSQAYPPDVPFGTANIFTFNPNAYPEPPSLFPGTQYLKLGGYNLGAYASLRLTPLRRVHLTTSVRYNKYKTESDQILLCSSIGFGCPTIGVSPTYLTNPRFTTIFDDHNFSRPNVSLSYDVTKHLSAYVTYADIYQSQGNDLTRGAAAPAGSKNVFLSGAPISPVRGYNIETGLKWVSPSGRLNANVALYSQVQNNLAIDAGSLQDASGFSEPISPNSPFACCFVASADSRRISRGVDVDVTGQVIEGLQLAASYTYNYNKQELYRLDYRTEKPVPDANFGNQLVTLSPAHLAKLWATYQFQTERWYKGLNIGFGANYQSNIFVNGSTCVIAAGTDNCQLFPTGFGYNAPKNVPYQFAVNGFAILAARLDYKINGKATVSINVDNLTNNHSYSSVGSLSSGNYYSQPRSFTVALRAKW